MDNSGLDEQGYIRTEVSLAKIPERFFTLVEAVKSAIVSAFEHQLHSLYLYGSVASGTAHAPTSDLDILIVFKSPPTPQVKETAHQLENELSQRFQSEVREVGLAITYLAEILEGEYATGGECFIKHLCVCLDGENLGAGLPKFKPTKAVAYGFNGDVRETITQAKRKLLENAPEPIDKTIRSISRKLIRTAFCLVMEEANCWTTNLSDSASIFSIYYPQHSTQIHRILQIAQGDQVSYDELINILNGFGEWLCEEVDQKLFTP